MSVRAINVAGLKVGVRRRRGVGVAVGVLVHLSRARVATGVEELVVPLWLQLATRTPNQHHSQTNRRFFRTL